MLWFRFLMALPQASALHDFVEKDEKQALADCVSRSLAETQAQAGNHDETIAAADAGAELAEVLQRHAAQRRDTQVGVVSSVTLPSLVCRSNSSKLPDTLRSGAIGRCFAFN